MTPEDRWQNLGRLQDEYPDFEPFLYDVLTDLMGFSCTPVQLDIAAYLSNGPLYRMVQAQRGQAKTTITAAYAVWRIIHRPSTRVLIVSAGGVQATEISNWIIQIINGMDGLECLRADKAHGDRASVDAYDVHWLLKGPEKSPSIASVGITSNLQGKRADVLVADDIESSKNSQTEGMRERLLHLTRDFASICSTGDIIYLGTPQSIDSVYNTLPSRGYGIRIWPGRFPTHEEEKNYGDFLAPKIKAAMTADPTLREGGGMLGDRGRPVDPLLMPEDALTKKEVDQGPAYFQLQHMLDTRLSDADRFPLKSDRIIFMNIPPTHVPMDIHHVRSPEYKISVPQDWPVTDSYFRAAGFGTEFGKVTHTTMYVDPAGGGKNGDETAYAVTQFLAGRILAREVGSVPGGVGDAALDALTAVAVKWKANKVQVEKNFGNGALCAVWTPKLLREHSCSIEEVWESGQKELRIIDILEPVIGSGRLVMDLDMIAQDYESTRKYPVQERASYSLFFQLSRITREKGALKHDDRVDALAGAVRAYVDTLKLDDKKAALAAAKQRYNDMMKDPLGTGRPARGHSPHRNLIPSVTRRMHRKV